MNVSVNEVKGFGFPNVNVTLRNLVTNETVVNIFRVHGRDCGEFVD